MPTGEVIHVAAMPVPEPSADLIRQIAAITVQPEYQARLTFAGPLPKIIGHFHDVFAAESAVKALNHLGLTAFTISECDLRRPVAAKFTACRLEMSDNIGRFLDHSGKSLELTPNDIFLIVAGHRAEAGPPAEKTTKMRLNLPATLLTGGLPIMKQVTAAGGKSEVTIEPFIRLYDRSSDVPVSEIKQHDLDYAFLGSRMASTTAGNFALTTDILMGLFSGAYFNRALVGGFAPGRGRAGGVDAVETSCRLLYRHYQALKRCGTSTNQLA